MSGKMFVEPGYFVGGVIMEYVSCLGWAQLRSAFSTKAK